MNYVHFHYNQYYYKHARVYYALHRSYTILTDIMYLNNIEYLYIYRGSTNHAKHISVSTNTRDRWNKDGNAIQLTVNNANSIINYHEVHI